MITMRMRSCFLLLALCAPVALAACSGSRTGDADTFVEAKRFLAQLEDEGVRVIERGTASSTLFNRPGLSVRANTTDVVQVFEYESEAEAQRDLQLIQDDVTRSPHFYQEGPLIAVQWGDDGRVADALEDLLGTGGY